MLTEAEVVDTALEISMLLIAYVRDDPGKLYPPLAQIAVREAKYLSNLIPKHFVANGDIDAPPLSTDEKFEYTIKVQLISLGNDDYVGFFNNHVISADLARLEEFSMDAYIKTLKSGGRDIMNTSLYGDDIFSHLVSGITLLHGLLL